MTSPRGAATPLPVLAGWDVAQRGVAVLAIVLLGAQIPLPMGLSAGYVFAAAILPMWLPSVRRAVGGPGVVTLGLLSAVSGLLLTVQARAAPSAAVPTTVSLVGLLLGVGVLVWCRTLMSTGAVALWFGTGLLVDIANGGALFATNPWKFGFAVPITVTALAAAHLLRRRWLEIAVLLGLAAAAALADARSNFVILLASAVLLVWQTRPAPVRERLSAGATLVGVVVIFVVMYVLGESLFLGGALGEETAERSRAQVEASGSLIVGGRPEIAASLALFEHQPVGFGSGTRPGPADVDAAKEGMAAINYDPDNGYVERYMFGDGFELHSLIADFWALFGLVGLGFAAFLVAVTLLGLVRGVAARTASGLVVFLAAMTLWNMLFSPFHSSIPLLMLAVAVLVELRVAVVRPPDAGAVAQRRYST